MNVTNNKTSQILPHLPPRSFNDCADTVHPLTSLHRAVWNYQKTAATSSIDLAQKVHRLSEQKMKAYEGRLGFILKFFSSLINRFAIGRWISSGELGLELANSIIEKISGFDEHGFTDPKEGSWTDEEIKVIGPDGTVSVVTERFYDIETWPDESDVDQMDDKFLGNMAVEFAKVWSEVDLAFATSCWSFLLAGVKKGKFTVLESGKRYRLELDEAVTGKMTAPFGVSVLMHLDKEIEITISRDGSGNYSFNFPNGGLSFEVTHPLVPNKMGRSIDQIAIFSEKQQAMIGVPIDEVDCVTYLALKRLAPNRLKGSYWEGYQFDMSQTLDFQETLDKLDALKWGE